MVNVSDEANLNQDLLLFPLEEGWMISLA